ncbi:MAG: tRNA pseudouridine(55) synthase, partial [Anaerolineae bacterium]|nr:tRNA pseudouridine(55) synthase [Anaerolineae bacterium]NIN95082.1 tRNA pseudouridine(55) synthase [Anaerolineae bacterium]NIQ78121.1 tRNA pseudouridine(55) synthase [Anaerolineae bacterium]
PREIRVYDLRLLGRDDRDVTFRITCSSGTYVRTLCHDIGRALGCGAHLRLLERVRVGPFSIETAVLPERLNAAGADGLRG